ncbi:hypothetical protein JHK86_012281 [Glycine max]|nr:hypothetical protein JHK86_012281 [Glycine max]
MVQWLFGRANLKKWRLVVAYWWFWGADLGKGRLVVVWAIRSSEREATGVRWCGLDLMNRRLLGGTMMVWVKRSNKGRLVVVLVSGSSEGRSVVLDAYWTQWVWKIYPLKEEDKNAFGMTQSKELATLLEAEKISCGKSEVDFIVVLDTYCSQWVWKIYHLEEEDKKAFGTTQHCLKQRRFRVVNLKSISLSLIFLCYIEYIIETNKEASGFSKIHPIIINIGTNNLETQKESDCTFLPLGFCGNPKQRFLPSTYPAEQIHSNMIKMSTTQSSTSSNVVIRSKEVEGLVTEELHEEMNAFVEIFNNAYEDQKPIQQYAKTIEEKSNFLPKRIEKN